MSVWSIRLSLLLYFLLLLAAALGTVSWFVHGLTTQTLHEKEASTEELIRSQCELQCKEARAALDRRILSQAQTIVSMARSTSAHFEGLYPLGLLGAAVLPQGYLLVPLWLEEGTNQGFAARLHRMQPLGFHIESAEDLVPEASATQPQEYFQVYRYRGHSALRSESLDDHDLPLTEQVRKQAGLYTGYWDNVELSAGKNVRRVTLKAHVPRFRASSLSFSWRLVTPETKKGFFNRSRASFPMQRFSGYETIVPLIFVQYASDTNVLENRLAEFQAERDQRLVELRQSTQTALREMHIRLWLLSLATFAGILVGGFVLVRFGLSPLARLSEAVSKVSARDFKLKVHAQELPKELKPIAARLSETLEELGKAFAREKQAAADISHELRTPLAALLTTIDVALRKPRSAEEYRDLLYECQGSGQQVMHLVERLLALARLDAGAERLRPRQLDVADLANQCAELVRPLAESRGLALRVHAEESLPLHADPDKMREVLTNLLHNAIEYNRPAGSIDLRVGRENGHVTMEVRDTGIGIAPALRERIFERFYRADPSRHSDGPHAGLGLSIVKSYVDLMGGRIEVLSDGAGSTFRVQVPASVAPLQRPS